MPMAENSRRYRVLFIHPGPVPPSTTERRNLLFHLSSIGHGDLVTTRWSSADDGTLDPATGRFQVLGDFRYHAMIRASSGILRPLSTFLYFSVKGVLLSLGGGRYDAIVTYGPFIPSIAGLVVSRLTGTPLIIDVPGHPTKGYRYSSDMGSRLRAWAAGWLVPAVLRRADRLKLLYPAQLDGLPGAIWPKSVVFHDFAPLSLIEREVGPAHVESHGDYLLFLGSPWFLKGVDVLIRAFNAISDKFPSVSLMVVGHCPDRSWFEELAAKNPRITFRAGVPHEEAMCLVAGCRALVLPSRTEGMGRVLLEAMAARKPIVASRVDGIPTYVEDGENGLLFEPEDVCDLAAKLELLLTNDKLAERLAEGGFSRVFDEFSEERYVGHFERMLKNLVRV
jgi:glycosyltransferase involved in cell wall biosynthesis